MKHPIVALLAIPFFIVLQVLWLVLLIVSIIGIVCAAASDCDNGEPTMTFAPMLLWKDAFGEA